MELLCLFFLNSCNIHPSLITRVSAKADVTYWASQRRLYLYIPNHVSFVCASHHLVNAQALGNRAAASSQGLKQTKTFTGYSYPAPEQARRGSRCVHVLTHTYTGSSADTGFCPKLIVYQVLMHPFSPKSIHVFLVQYFDDCPSEIKTSLIRSIHFLSFPVFTIKIYKRLLKYCILVVDYQ